ncbi:MAG: hypothetical protein KBD53_03085 [Candidatus Omnitrophica bacterium]|nr:hypothetical protein [Candidatus Omnitrophota bacterium]
MKQKKIQPKVIPILRSSFHLILTNKTIIFPYALILFFQLLILEILYFIPRWPLNVFFDPIISKLWSENSVHYPFNIALLPKLFYFATMPAYILLFSFLICMSISTIMMVNNDERPKLGKAFKRLLPYYVYIVVGAAIMLFVNVSLIHGFDLIFARATRLQSTTGPLYWLKMTIIHGAAYFKILLNILGTTLFAYVFPLIVIEKRNVFIAIFENLKYVFTAPIKTFFLVFFPTLLYVMIILFKGHVPMEAEIPEMRVLYISLSALVTIFMDAMIYTSITTFYLLRKGQ